MKKVSLSAAEFAARMAVALQDVNKMQYIAYENEQGELWFPAPSPTYQVGTMDSAGRLRLGGAAGQVPSTEDNSASIAGSVVYLRAAMEMASSRATFAAVAVAALDEAELRVLSPLLTATAGGEITVADLVPALAGYRSCMMLKRIWSDQTDGTINLTFGTTSGLSNGPVTVNIATTANQIAPDWADGIPFRGSAINEAITVLSAAGQTVANQEFQFIGTFWYEVV